MSKISNAKPSKTAAKNHAAIAAEYPAYSTELTDAVAIAAKTFPYVVAYLDYIDTPQGVVKIVAKIIGGFRDREYAEVAARLFYQSAIDAGLPLTKVDIYRAPGVVKDDLSLNRIYRFG